jgi:hypothetical protein
MSRECPRDATDAGSDQRETLEIRDGFPLVQMFDELRTANREDNQRTRLKSSIYRPDEVDPPMMMTSRLRELGVTFKSVS